MALNAAWPLLANAKPADPAAEICSATGLTHAAGGAPALPDKGYHASHCNLCPFGADRGAGIAVTTAVLPIAASVPARVFARGETPQHQTALYPAAPPRAPPILS
jgi:hypothetical protein